MKRFCSILVFVFWSVVSQAATFNVNSTGDNPDTNTSDGICLDVNASCTLRAAIEQANTTPESDTITLAEETYVLLDSLDAISTEISIVGNPSNANTVHLTRDTSAALFRILDITSSGVLTLNGVKISNGDDTFGAGLRNSGDTILQNSIVTNNRAMIGGGVYNTGTVTITNSTISDNSVTSNGGGIFLQNGILLIHRSSLQNNTATGSSGSSGGGVYIGGTSTSVKIYNSTLYNNSADDDGGGFYNLTPATTRLENTTFCNNTAGDQGGGFFTSASSTIVYKNNLFSENTAAGFGPDCKYGTLAIPGPSEGFNMISDATGCFLNEQETDYLNVPGNLDAFQDNGSAGNGHCPLKSVSAAINNGPSVCPDENGNATDQLGQTRSGNCDRGAVEFLGTAATADFGDSGESPLEESDASAGDEESGEETSDEGTEEDDDTTDSESGSASESASSSGGCSLTQTSRFTPSFYFLVLLFVLFHVSLRCQTKICPKKIKSTSPRFKRPPRL